MARIENLKLLQSFFGELLASFIFGFTVYSTVLSTKYEKDPANPVIVNLGVAFSGIAIIYAFADHTISHFNPAITLSAMLTLKLDFINGIGFIISQVIGFILAALFCVVVFPGTYMDIMEQLVAGPGVDSDVPRVCIFFAEFIFTAILVFVAFEVGVNARRDPNHSLYQDEELQNRTIVAPLTIGLTLGFLSLLGAKNSGGSFNPGLVFAPNILSNNWPWAWELYVGEFTGGLAGALVQVWLLFK
ncbi:hypothetical protein PAPHI01_1675 [Pancytospora philotis]|nr:hypothetical protein PAPHI01_1675 [Pancytospora philotis]